MEWKIIDYCTDVIVHQPTHKTFKKMTTVYTKEDKIKLLEVMADSSSVTKACKDCNIGRDTHYRWLKNDAEYAEEFKKIDDMVIDLVEDCFMENIKSGNVAAQIFFLKTRGRKRGYEEKQEHVHRIHDDIIDKLK